MYYEVMVLVYRLFIRGDPKEEAVLCTEDKTYELRVADTSNALLTVPSLSLPKDSGSTTRLIQLSFCPTTCPYVCDVSCNTVYLCKLV